MVEAWVMAVDEVHSVVKNKVHRPTTRKMNSMFANHDEEDQEKVSRILRSCLLNMHFLIHHHSIYRIVSFSRIHFESSYHLFEWIDQSDVKWLMLQKTKCQNLTRIENEMTLT